MPQALHLVDASPYIFRAYYSLPTSIVSPAGKPVNAVRGFGDFLARLIGEERPTHVLVAFDGSLTTSFRNDIYPAYKSSRDLPDGDLVAQLEACQRVAASLGLACAIDGRYEADDIVATARHRFAGDFDSFVVVSADKDMTQLVDERTTFYDFGKGRKLDADGVLDKMGVRPTQVPDLLGLAGDSVDDIPGVRGVGPKTATALLAEFGDLDLLFSGLDRVAELPFRGSKSMGAKLEAARDDAFLSRQLATCATDAPLEFTDAAQLARRPIDGDEVARIGAELGLEGIARAAARIQT